MTEKRYPTQPVATGWRCPACGAETPTTEIRVAQGWRWNGMQWEHRCDHVHPQAGHFQAEPIGELADHYIWEVDSGATWWVVAADENDALALVVEMENLAGHDVVKEDWQVCGWPTPECVDFERGSQIGIYDEDTDAKMSVLLWFTLDGTRRALGCSEW